MWTYVIMDQLQELSWHLSGMTEVKSKTSAGTANLMIWTQNLLNMKQECS